MKSYYLDISYSKLPWVLTPPPPWHSPLRQNMFLFASSFPQLFINDHVSFFVYFDCELVNVTGSDIYS